MSKESLYESSITPVTAHKLVGGKGQEEFLGYVLTIEGQTPRGRRTTEVVGVRSSTMPAEADPKRFEKPDPKDKTRSIVYDEPVRRWVNDGLFALLHLPKRQADAYKSVVRAENAHRRKLPSRT